MRLGTTGAASVSDRRSLNLSALCHKRTSVHRKRSQTFNNFESEPAATNLISVNVPTVTFAITVGPVVLPVDASPLQVAQGQVSSGPPIPLSRGVLPLPNCLKRSNYQATRALSKRGERVSKQGEA
jgi:hypothetical protein